jgi:cysteine desulfuration protein SufE
LNIQDLIDDFAFLDDWEDRYKQVIELGKALPPLTEQERSPGNKVAGCVSQVWLVTEVGPGPQLTFRGQSDAHIVQGLIAILLMIYSGKTAHEICDIDARAMIGQLGLDDALSPQRSNGLFAMVGRIRHDAEAALSKIQS